jgi:hypothetical protein
MLVLIGRSLEINHRVFRVNDSDSQARSNVRSEIEIVKCRSVRVKLSGGPGSAACRSPVR